MIAITIFIAVSPSGRGSIAGARQDAQPRRARHAGHGTMHRTFLTAGCGARRRRRPGGAAILAATPEESSRMNAAMKIDLAHIDELARRLSSLVPSGLREGREELQQNFKSVLQTGLGKLDLVTRDEFDVQRAVLLRTRDKLNELQRAIDKIEAQLAANAAQR
jgi:BMFP domain-containing protein YqiC